LVSRMPAILILLALGALFLLRSPAATLPWWLANEASDGGLSTVLSFEALLFTIAVAFLLLAMAKERTELQQKKAAMLDSLTGFADRGAFLRAAANLACGRPAHPRPVALLIFDIDRVRSINDRF